MSYQSGLQPISCSISLSSCRLKAEAIARALNNRIWPGALLNDCDDHSSGDEELQVRTTLKGPCGTRSATVVDRPPQAHTIYDSGDRVIGHCWLNGMQMDDDDEYFDTPPCSSPPSPEEEEIIVNPPTHNGISPFFPEYQYRENEPQGSADVQSSSGCNRDERIASGTKLFEKLQRYSESLSQTEEGSETFYDVSDYEDYEEQSATIPRVLESDRSEHCNEERVTQSTEANGSTGAEIVENQCLSSSNVTTVTTEDEANFDPLLLDDVNIAMQSEGNEENCADRENHQVSENSPASEKCYSVPDEASSNSGQDEREDDQQGFPDGALETSDSDPHNFYARRKTKFVKSTEESLTGGESSQSYPEIEIVPASPLTSSTSFSSTSDDEIRELPSERAVLRTDDNQLPTDFRLRRIQELEEEERPKLLRSTSLKTGKTPPGTPGRKKIVRFADALGLDLEAVRHIVQDDLPIVPSSAYTDLDLSELEDEAKKPAPPITDRIAFPGSSWHPTAGAGVQSLIPQFQPPSTNPDFLDRVRRQYVCLESILVSDLTLHCTCRVLNVSFEKFVAARYTTNEWQTCEEVIASYVPNSSDGEFDKFSFSLFLRYLLPHQRLLLAIRYIVGGTEYWDNNYGENYALRCYSNASTLPSTDDGPSWIHHFY